MTFDLRLPLAITALGGALLSVRFVARPIVPIEVDGRMAAETRPQAVSPTVRMPADSVAAVVSRDPFRIGRRPVLPAYDPLKLAEQQAPPPPKPTFVLVGVLDGVTPSAVIEGFPGVDGSRVVRVGDVIAGFAVKGISAGRVIIAGMDTTWRLEVREPWKN
jgi:hypothetical protein